MKNKKNKDLSLTSKERRDKNRKISYYNKYNTYKIF